ncbi:MAG TPA: hypothetical protein VFC23_13050 [Thermoanaerobaculia bacterium]|nr:hypothetical protein [Thermoanaerobaculia bacterium]
MKSEKQFDAVKTMREIRVEISREIQGMSFEQEREYIEKHLKFRRAERGQAPRMTTRCGSRSAVVEDLGQDVGENDA